MDKRAIFIQILNMSITSSFVIAVVFAVRMLIRGLPKKYSFLLWAVVGIRLACPVFISSPFSMFNLAGGHNIVLHSSTEDSARDTKSNTPKTTALPTASHSILEETTPPLPANEHSSIEETATKASSQKETSQKTSGRKIQQTCTPAARKSAKNNQKTTTHNSQVQYSLAAKLLSRSGLLHGAKIIWLLGMAVIFTWNLYLAIRMRGRLRKAVLYSGNSSETTAPDTKRNIYECDGIASPFVVGLVNPKIYIPFRLLPEELSYILKHEQYHICRKDYLTKFIACILTSIHWFNPLVWAAFHAMTQDMEMSCDEYVLTEIGTQIKTDYSQSLLAFATNQRRFSMSLLAFGETDARKRVKHIMKFQTKKKWMGILSTAIILFVSTACLTNNQASELKEELPQARQAAAKSSQTVPTPIPQPAEGRNVIPIELLEGEHLTAGKARDLMNHLVNQEIPDRTRTKLVSNETSDITYYSVAIYDKYEGYNELNHSVLEQYQENQNNWSVAFDHSLISGCTVLDDGVAVYGHHPFGGEGDEYYNWLALVSSSGEMLWQAILNHGFVGEPVFDIIEEPNGLAVFSWGDTNFLCFSRYSMNGRQISYKKYETSSHEIERLITCSDGYILQLRGENGGGEVIRMQKDGSIMETYTYAQDGKDYFYTDAAMYNGKLYISAYAVPQLPRGGGWGLPYVLNEEATLVLSKIFRDDDFEFTNEQLNELVKTNYTATLFVCEPESGEIKLLQSVDAAIGGICSIDANEHFVWNAAKIQNTYLSFDYHPLYSGGFYIGGVSGGVRYIYDKNEQLLSWQETGETVEFRR